MRSCENIENTCLTFNTLRRFTAYDNLPAQSTLAGTQLLGDCPITPLLVKTYLHSGQVWCLAPPRSNPCAAIGLASLTSLAHAAPATALAQTAKAVAPLLPGVELLWLGFAFGPAASLPILLEEACHRAANQYPNCRLAAPVYAKSAYVMAQFFSAGFCAFTLCPMAYLRPCYLLVKGAPPASADIVNLPFDDSYQISRHMENGYIATGFSAVGVLQLALPTPTGRA